MPTKKRKSKAVFDDGDDAHFSDNPAVAKRTRRKWEAQDRKRVGGVKQSSPLGAKRAAKKTQRKRVAGK